MPGMWYSEFLPRGTRLYLLDNVQYLVYRQYVVHLTSIDWKTIQETMQQIDRMLDIHNEIVWC